MGDMAVSNSIGSNIFDVLLGLGFPWALRTLIVSYGSVVGNNCSLSDRTNSIVIGPCCRQLFLPLISCHLSTTDTDATIFLCI